MPVHSLHQRNLVPLTVSLLFALVAVFGFIASRAQSPAKDEREVEDTIPKHLPIKVKVKKPERLKDVEHEGWVDDAELEVTNTGTKPIYFLDIHLVMPDALSAGGLPYSFLYYYGRVELGDFGEPVQPTDVPIQPGQTVTLKPMEGNIEGWKIMRGKGKVSNPHRLEFQFQEINHGDHTGFVGYDGTPIPTKKRSSSWPPASGRDANGRDVAVATNSPPIPFFDAVCLT